MTVDPAHFFEIRFARRYVGAAGGQDQLSPQRGDNLGTRPKSVQLRRYSVSKPWLVNLSVRFFSVAVRTTCSGALDEISAVPTRSWLVVAIPLRSS